MLRPYPQRRNQRPQYGALAGLGYLAKTLRPRKSTVASDIQQARSLYNKMSQSNRAPANPLKGRKVNKKRYRRKTKLGKIKKQIRSLQQTDRATTGTMKFRVFSAIQRLVSAINGQNALNVNPIGKTNIEAVLAQLKYFDPSNPGTLLVGSGVAGSYQRNVLIESISSKVLVRNNYKNDAKVTIYHCSAKDDTNQAPLSAWIAGVPDGSNLASFTSLSNYPTDYNIVNDLWKLKVLGKQVLSPGQSLECSYYTPSFQYDSSTVDVHSLEFQSEYKASQLLVVLEGTLSHDSALDEQGIGQAGLDISYNNTYKVKYSAGLNISYIYVTNTTNTPTNGFVQSQKPTVANAGYGI